MGDGKAYDGSCSDEIKTSRYFFKPDVGQDQKEKKARCSSFSSQLAIGGVNTRTDAFPGVKGTVITKVNVGHPHKAEPNIGHVILKRLVMHNTSTGHLVADVYKVGRCFKCPMESVNFNHFEKNLAELPQSDKTNLQKKGVLSSNEKKRTIFEYTGGHYVTSGERKVLIQSCVQHAFQDNGEIKPGYKCPSTLQSEFSEYAERDIATESFARELYAT